MFGGAQVDSGVPLSGMRFTATQRRLEMPSSTGAPEGPESPKATKALRRETPTHGVWIIVALGPPNKRTPETSKDLLLLEPLGVD